MRSRPGWTSLFVCERSGGSFVRIAVIVSAAVSPRNARWPDEHLVEDRAEGEEVGALVGRLARAPAPATCSRSCRARRRAPCPETVCRSVWPVSSGLGLQLRETEVEDLDAPVLRQEQVLGLQVAVDDPLLVRRGEAPRDLHRVVDRLAHRERARRAAARAASRPRAAPSRCTASRRRRADVVDRGDVRDGSGPPRPAPPARSACSRSGVLREARRQDLDRDLAPEPRVLRPVDLAHPSGADRREDLVGAELAFRRTSVIEAHGF